MPHLDSLASPLHWTVSGHSRFARPVAAITAFARNVVVQAVAITERGRLASAKPRKDAEISAREIVLAEATDMQSLERMERDWDRRDAGGMRSWDWR